ncbi:hypothetical protein A0J61_10301, partial [Choanephora cucurbitarum]
MSRILQRVLEEGVKDNAPTKNLLKTIAAKYYNVCEISAQEAAYNLLSLRMTESSRGVIFVPTGLVGSRARMMKSKEALQNLPEFSSDVFCNGMVEYYSHRLDSLESLNFAGFCAYYQYFAKKRILIRRTNDKDIDEETNNINEEDEVEGGFLELKEGYGFIKRRKKAKVIRYYKPNAQKDSKLYSHHLVMLYLPWRDQFNEIDKQDCQSLFRQNKQAIEEAANEFSKLPD